MIKRLPRLSCMVRLRRKVNTLGVTLIELLCTMAIILVLAGLLLGPASRALRKVRADQWANRCSARLPDAVTHLRKHLERVPSYGLVTLQRIESNHWVGALELDFLRDRRVTFTPFTDSDPDDKIVIAVHMEAGNWSEGNIETRCKADLTKAPE